LLILCSLGVLHSLYIMSGVGDIVSRAITLWVLAVVLDVLLGVLSLRVARVQTTKPARRLWTTLGGVAFLIAVGDAIQLGWILAEPTAKKVVGGPVPTICFAVGMFWMTIAMLRYPVAAMSSRQRRRSVLDTSTVLVGGAVVIWAFATDPSAGPLDLAVVVNAAAVALISLYAALRLVLSGSAPVTQLAAAPMVAAMLLQVMVAYFAPVEPGDVSAGRLLLGTWPAFLVLAGPRLQELQMRASPDVPGLRQHKPHSALPYVAVGSTFVLLIGLLPGGVNTRLWGVVLGTVTIIALIVTRQILAFRDNASLINQIDSAMAELRQHEKRLRHNASHDPLTGLLNREGLGERVTAALAKPADQSDVALLLVDLDDFKTVNDTLGHAAGDRLLVEVATRLRVAAKPHEVVARLGGDEFAVMLRGATGADAELLGRFILASLNHPVTIAGQDLRVQASAGAAAAARDDDFISLLRNADIALYEAKDRGKGGFVRYAADMKARLFETAELGARLRDAINASEFGLVYQPIVQFHDGRIVGVEALLRWHRPGVGIVPPEDFIAAAERTGLIVPLGRWVLREACLQAASWLRTYGTEAPVSMSVNVSGRQFREPGFVDDVASALRETGLPPERLTIEMIETAVLDGGQANRTLHELRALGVGLALDDFGTAESSLGLLLTCPVTSLKLDRSFVDGIVTTTRQAAVATAVVQIARALDLNLVAEGIETREQAELLQELGYRLAQGFMYYHPLPAPDMHELWRSASPDPDQVVA
jgi:diguanylate cyclase